MGAEFVCGILSMKINKTPDWEAAINWLNGSCQLLQIADEFPEYFDELPDQEAIKNRLLTAFDMIKEGWEGHHRYFVRFDYKPLKATLLITGDRTWGDRVEEISSMVLFQASGMAEAAGFKVS